MRTSLLILALLITLCSASALWAQSTKSGGYVLICVGKGGEDKWNLACLDMPLKVDPPPSVSSYSGNLAGIWTTLFPNTSLAVSPALIDRSLSEFKQLKQFDSETDSLILFAEFIRLSKTFSLTLTPLVKITPSTSVTHFRNTFSTELSPVVILTDAALMDQASWRQFTVAGSEAFQLVTEKSYKITDDGMVANFWKNHIPTVLSLGTTKVSISNYSPLDGYVIYRCEALNYQGMAQSFLDFFTRPQK